MQVLRRYGAYKDFRAKFKETAISRASGEGQPESGTVSFRRPDMWRWDYDDPEKKLVVIRGGIATISVEGEPEVTQYDLGSSDERSSVAALLAGSEAIGTMFSASFEPAGSEEASVLRLEPLTLSDEYDHVVLKIRRRDPAILEVVVVDPGGNSLRFVFSGFRADTGLAESVFEPPKGVPREPQKARPSAKP